MMRLRPLLALCMLLTVFGISVVMTRAGDATGQEHPPDGWYLIADLPDSPYKGASEKEERTWTDGLAETARSLGYEDARVWPAPKTSPGCWQPNPKADGSWGYSCAKVASARRYVVVLKGPYSQPPVADPDPRHEWRRRVWLDELEVAASRGWRYGVLPGIYMFTATPGPGPADDWDLAPVPVDKVAPVIDGTELPDGWYLAVSPGAFTSEKEGALYSARAMAWQLRQAGYRDITIVRWPAGPKKCSPWGCDERRPVVVYVVVLGEPYPAPANPETDPAWQAELEVKEQLKARERGLVLTPFVVPLHFSGTGQHASNGQW